MLHYLSIAIGHILAVILDVTFASLIQFWFKPDILGLQDKLQHKLFTRNNNNSLNRALYLQKESNSPNRQAEFKGLGVRNGVIGNSTSQIPK